MLTADGELDDVFAIDGADYGHHFCALRSDGKSWCWGRNDSSQLGMRMDARSDYAVRVVDNEGEAFEGVTSFSAGSDSTPALTEDSERVYCWGSNDSTQFRLECTWPVARQRYPLDRESEPSTKRRSGDRAAFSFST